MCGICGIVDYNNRIDESQLDRMCDIMVYRGPDEKGKHIERDAGLAIRRLIVIDLKTGHQPIYNENKKIWVVCNGEIYNFKELKAELKKKGHKFYTNSDVEVIVHLYEDYKDDCVRYLRGMFAFAVWDENNRRLFLARDRLGQKPLVYAKVNDKLLFASEIKSILECPEVKKEVDYSAVNHYLTYQYIPAPMTMFKAIKKLPPACTLTYSKDKDIRIRKYWDLDYRDKLNLTEEEYCQRINELLEESTKLRMISDVPLGALLSGGVDSSAVVGMMSRFSSKPVKTFTVNFEEKEYSEAGYAKTVAEYFGTDHHEIFVKPDALEILPKLIWHYNEPFADSSAIPSYYISKETRKYVTVVLNGDGGDENFAGYNRYRREKLAFYYRNISGALNGATSAFIKNLPGGGVGFIRRLKSLSKIVSLPVEKRIARWCCIIDNERKEGLYTPDMGKEAMKSDALDYMSDVFLNSKADNWLDKVLYTEIMTYLPGDLLVKMDIASMSNSLEARSPFLDHKLMEFTARIPSNLKLKGLNGKYVLKKALKKTIPDEILNRKKMGFAVPVGSWFRNELKDYIKDTLLDKNCIKRGYFKEKSVLQLIDEHISGRIDHGHRLWTLLNLELWHKVFIDNVKI